MTPSIADLIAQAMAGLDALAATAEPIADEWQYVTDLGTVWSARLRAVADARADEAPPAGAEAAIQALAEEAGRITDPHRAIDWLSTFPQVALAAVGEAG